MESSNSDVSLLEYMRSGKSISFQGYHTGEAERVNIRSAAMMGSRGPAFPMISLDNSKELAEENKLRRTMHSRIMETTPTAFRRKKIPDGPTSNVEDIKQVHDLLGTMHPYKDPLDIDKTKKSSKNFTVSRVLEKTQQEQKELEDFQYQTLKPIDDFLRPSELNPRTIGYEPGHIRNVMKLDTYGPANSELTTEERNSRGLPFPNTDRYQDYHSAHGGHHGQHSNSHSHRSSPAGSAASTPLYNSPPHRGGGPGGVGAGGVGGHSGRYMYNNRSSYASYQQEKAQREQLYQPFASGSSAAPGSFLGGGRGGATGLGGGGAGLGAFKASLQRLYSPSGSSNHSGGTNSRPSTAPLQQGGGGAGGKDPELLFMTNAVQEQLHYEYYSSPIIPLLSSGGESPLGQGQGQAREEKEADEEEDDDDDNKDSRAQAKRNKTKQQQQPNKKQFVPATSPSSSSAASSLLHPRYSIRSQQDLHLAPSMRSLYYPAAVGINNNNTVFVKDVIDSEGEDDNSPLPLPSSPAAAFLPHIQTTTNTNNNYNNNTNSDPLLVIPSSLRRHQYTAHEQRITPEDRRLHDPNVKRRSWHASFVAMQRNQQAQQDFSKQVKDYLSKSQELAEIEKRKIKEFERHLILAKYHQS